MFGTYRTILALAVVCHHLLKVPAIGQYAVHGFFILSGYLMTTVMNRSYAYSLRGIGSFAVNRFLRLYPSYWLILFCTVLVINFWGAESVAAYHSVIEMPSGASEWLQNLSLVYPSFIPMEVHPRLSPPTWALTVDLLFYFLIAVGASSSKRITNLWFAASIIYSVSTHLLGLGTEYRYMHLAAGSLPFSMGAMIYHHQRFVRDRFGCYAKLSGIVILLGLFLGNSLLGGIVKLLAWPDALASMSLYLNLIINFCFVSLLMCRPILPLSRDQDKWIGDFSYPIYLCHWQAGFVASMIIWNRGERGPNLHGIVSFGGALVICLVVSLVLMHFVDRPIEKLRSIIRSKADDRRINN